MDERVFVGREGELQELGQHLEAALGGKGAICFVTGEAGSGKTALVRHFVGQALAADPDLVVALGSCNAQVGAGDPYLPFREVLAHPHTSTLAAFFASTFHQLVRQWPQCQAEAERALALAGRGRFPFWQAGCTMLRGSALARRGAGDEGIAVLQEGLARWEATGTRVALPYFRARLAEAFLGAGRRQEGLGALEQSFFHGEEVWWHAEQHRLHAELLLLAPGNEAEAEIALRRALQIARDQKAKSLELRAAKSLARLLRGLGRTAEGRELLAGCYAWFGEGFDTADLREARDLLEDM